jgi:hypothetical protein
MIISEPVFFAMVSRFLDNSLTTPPPTVPHPKSPHIIALADQLRQGKVIINPGFWPTGATARVSV